MPPLRRSGAVRRSRLVRAAWGTCQPSANAIGLGPDDLPAPLRGGMARGGSHGRFRLAFRPACASCMPGTAPCAATNCAIRASISTWRSSQMPRSCGLMRPRGSIAVASVGTSPAPPTARDPRCTRCQSVANPSTLLYWHIGETPIRLRSVTPRIVSGSNRCGIERTCARTGLERGTRCIDTLCNAHCA